MIGITNLSTGGGIGSDELTATSANVLDGTMYVGADTDDEIGIGTMINRMKMKNSPGINSNYPNTPLHIGNNVQMNTATDGSVYLGVAPPTGYYEAGGGTYVGAKINDVNNAIGLTEGKLLAGQKAGNLTGTATNDANVVASQMSNQASAYAKGVKVTGSLVERGQAQWGGASLTSSYLAINALPEGIYRSNGASWAPEARASYAAVRNAIGLTAGVLKKGVTILGTTGTWDGFVATTGYIYNRGTWGNGYGSLSAIGVPSGRSVNIYSEASAIRVYSSGPTYDESSSWNYAELQLNNAINLSAYNKITCVISGCAGGSWNSHGNWSELRLYCKVVNASGGNAAITYFTGDRYDPGTTEYTVDIDVSSLNITGYLRINLVNIASSGGLGGTRCNSTSYIHIIKLS